MEKCDGAIATSAGEATSAGCDEKQVLETALTQALRLYSGAMRTSRERGFPLGDSGTEALGARVMRAWAELGQHDEQHGCH